MKTIESLIAEKAELVKSYLDDPEKKAVDALPKIKEIEAQIKAIKTEKALEAVNAKNKYKRDLAKLAFNTEKPETDVTCSDGSFHKTKIKKYPKLEALKYARATKTKDNLILKISLEREIFVMYKPEYKSGKETEYTEFADFAEFMEYNWVEPKDITLAEYLEIVAKLKNLNTELQTAIKSYKDNCNALNVGRLSNYGLLSHGNEHLYTWSEKI